LAGNKRDARSNLGHFRELAPLPAKLTVLAWHRIQPRPSFAMVSVNPTRYRSHIAIPSVYVGILCFRWALIIWVEIDCLAKMHIDGDKWTLSIAAIV
jgi:hypothetical protein